MESSFGRNKNHLFYVSILMKFCNILSKGECTITGKEKRNCILTLWMPSSCSCIRSARPTTYSALFNLKKKKKTRKFRYITNILALFSLSTTIKSIKIIASCTSIVTEIHNNTQYMFKLESSYTRHIMQEQRQSVE
jgi:hypothetical protein